MLTKDLIKRIISSSFTFTDNFSYWINCSAPCKGISYIEEVDCGLANCEDITLYVISDRPEFVDFYKEIAIKAKELSVSLCETRTIDIECNAFKVQIKTYHSEKYNCNVLWLEATRYTPVNIGCCDDDLSTPKFELKSKNKKETKTIVYYENRNVMCQNSNDIFLPITLNDLSQLPLCIRNPFFELFSEQSPVLNELSGYDILPPIPVNKTLGITTKKDLLESFFKFTVPDIVNEKDFIHMYSACCAYPYVAIDQRNLLFTVPWNLNEDKCYMFFADSCKPNVYDSDKSLEKNYICLFYEKKFAGTCLPPNAKKIINKYVGASIEEEQPINLTLDFDGIEYAWKNLVLLSRKDHIINIPKSPFSKIRLPAGFTKIQSWKKLHLESNRYRNLDLSYVPSINQGKCLLCAVDINNEHIVVEIRYNKKTGYFIQKIFSCNGGSCSKETLNYISNAIKASNKLRFKKRKS